MTDVAIDSRLELPVWLEPPNWATGLLEANAWQTWIGVSESMAEQRVAQRRFPRRTWDIPFRGFGYRQSLIQQMLVSAGRRQWLLPLFPYRSRLAEPAAEGSRQLLGDFTLRQYVVDELVLIRDPEDFYRYEIGILSAVSDAQVSLVEGLQFEWAADAEIYPLRVCRVIDDARATLRSAQVLDVTVRFEQDTIERQEIDVSDWERHPLDGYPILGIQNNWREDPTIQYQRDVDVLDNQQGRPHYYDVGGQSTLSTIWRVMTRGRQELNDLRSMQYYLRGQQNLVWLSTLSDDIEVVEQVVPADGEIVIRRVGLAQYGADKQEVRRDIIFDMVDGERIYGRMVSARTDGNTERIILADNLEVPYLPSDFKRVNFLVKARLATDRVEIKHYADADGAQETALPFLLLDNPRMV